MSGDYGYANARLRAMKSRLLNRADYEALLARRSAEELCTALADTAYGEDMEWALLHHTGVRCVAEAVRRNVVHTFQKVRGFFEPFDGLRTAPGEPRTLIDLLLGRWDLHNVKTVVRGQAVRATATEMLEAVVPAGQLDNVALENLVQQPGLQAAVDLMVTQRLPLAHPLAVAIRDYRGRENLPALELTLDRAYFAAALEQLQGGGKNVTLLRRMVEADIDITNLTTLLLLRQGRVPGEAAGNVLLDWLIPGGTLGDRRWRDMAAAGTIEEVLGVLEETPYHVVLERGLANGVVGGQRALEAWLARRGMRMFHGDPLSIAIPIGYVWAKTTEVANLRVIAYGVAEKLRREEIREDLILGP